MSWSGIARRPGRLVACLLAVCLAPALAGADPWDDAEGLPIREVRIEGLSRVPEARVRANLVSREGEPFRRATVALDRRQLDALRWFSRIALSPVVSADSVVLRVELTETFRYLFTPSIGVTDLDGVTVGGGARVLNLGPQGAQASMSARFGGATSVRAGYERTTLTPRAWPFSAVATFRDATNSLFEFEERSLEIVTRAGRNLTRRARAGVSGGYLRMDAQGSDPTVTDDGIDHVPQLGGWLLFDSYDSQTTPTRGWRLEGEVARLLGDASAWSSTLDVRRYQPLAARHIVALDGLVSHRSGDVGTALPYYLEFGLGGANTVRGWPLGARVGRNQLLGSAEYQFAALPPRAFRVKGFNLYGGIHVAAFADWGVAWTDGPELSVRNGIGGYGVGLRVFMPFVDLLRVDLAHGEPGQGLSFSFGVDFKANRQRDRVR